MSIRPSDAQMETLIGYMEKYPEFIRNRTRTATGRYKTKEEWEELSKILNSMEGLKKTPKQWSKFWADKKYHFKKKMAYQRNAVARRQKFGFYPINTPLTEQERRILHIVGSDESWPEMKRATPAIRNPVRESQSGRPSPIVSHEGSQSDSSSLQYRRPRNLLRRQRSQAMIERKRLTNIEENMAAAVAAQANGFSKTVRALDNLAKAVKECGQNIAEALRNLQ